MEKIKKFFVDPDGPSLFLMGLALILGIVCIASSLGPLIYKGFFNA